MVSIKTLRCVLTVSSVLFLGAASARDRVVIVPAHPDDLIAALGFCHLARDVFEVSVRSNGDFALIIDGVRRQVRAGTNMFARKGE